MHPVAQLDQAEFLGDAHDLSRAMAKALTHLAGTAQEPLASQLLTLAASAEHLSGMVDAAKHSADG